MVSGSTGQWKSAISPLCGPLNQYEKRVPISLSPVMIVFSIEPDGILAFTMIKCVRNQTAARMMMTIINHWIISFIQLVFCSTCGFSSLFGLVVSWDNLFSSSDTFVSFLISFSSAGVIPSAGEDPPAEVSLLSLLLLSKVPG